MDQEEFKTNPTDRLLLTKKGPTIMKCYQCCEEVELTKEYLEQIKWSGYYVIFSLVLVIKTVKNSLAYENFWHQHQTKCPILIFCISISDQK